MTEQADAPAMPRRLTPNLSYEPAPARTRRGPLRIAGMDWPVLVVLFGAMCGYRLFWDNLVHAGWHLHLWTRARLHFGQALNQALLLVLVLAAVELFLRLGKAKSARAEAKAQRRVAR